MLKIFSKGKNSKIFSTSINNLIKSEHVSACVQKIKKNNFKCESKIIIFAHSDAYWNYKCRKQKKKWKICYWAEIIEFY